MDGGGVMKKQPISYLQGDSRWGGLPYTSTGDKSQTIKSSGCGPACAAMLAAIIDPSITPKEACAWSVAKGYRHATQGTLYSFFKAYGKMLGLDWGQLNASNLRNLSAGAAASFHGAALEAVRAGKPVVCCMGPGNWTTSGHYILWWKEEGGTVYINDPASTKAARVKNTLALLQAEVKYYFVCSMPETEEIELTREELKSLIREVMAEDNPVYGDLGDVPDYWRGQVKAMLEAGAINGGTPAEENPTDVNIRRETLKAAIIAAMYHDARETEPSEA